MPLHTLSQCLQAMLLYTLNESATMLSQAIARIVQSASGTATLTSADSKHTVALTRVNVKALPNFWLCTLALYMLAQSCFTKVPAQHRDIQLKQNLKSKVDLHMT